MIVKQLKLLISIVVFAYSFTSISAQNIVLVEATNTGQGIIRKVENKNYIIAPKAIFTDFDKEAFIIGLDKFHTKAIRVSNYYNSELVILKTIKNSGSNIKTLNWSNEEIIDFTNGYTFKGSLTLLQKDQSVINLPVSVKNVGEKYITISLDNNKIITKKMLGGILKFNNLIVGMLVKIDEDGILGDIMKINALKEITDSFFDTSIKEEKELSKKRNALEYAYRSFSCSSNRAQCRYDAELIIRLKDLMSTDLTKFHKLHYGEDRNNLSGIIDLNSLINDPDYNKTHIDIPKRIGSNTMYYQYEFTDLTRSKIYEVLNVNSQTVMEGVGYEMKPTKSKNGISPSVFVGPHNLPLIPASPAYATYVLYSFNAIDYTKLNPIINKTGLYSIFEIPPNTMSKNLFLKFILSNEKILGPFEYNFKNWDLFEKENAKLKLIKSMNSSFFECFRIGKRPEIDSSTKDRQQLNKNYAKQKAWDRIILSKKLSFAKNHIFPSIVCKCKDNNTNKKVWMAVKQIKSDNKQNNLEGIYTVKKNIKESYISSLKKTYIKEAYVIWEKTFPNSSQAIFLQLDYFDGDSSPVMRIPIKDLRQTY